MAYDANSDRIVLYGGLGENQILSDTWAYDVEANAWTNQMPVSRPPPLSAHVMAYDAESDRIVLFGGQDGSGYQDLTWAYDLDTNTWTDRAPAQKPPALWGASMVYDAQSDRFILFGGSTTFDYSQQTWAYDFNANTWMPKSPARAPAPRCCHAMAYDSQSDRVVLFGGDTNGRKYDDTWAYDFETDGWTELAPSAAPSPRAGARIGYDARSNRSVLFGGSAAGGTLNDTWAYDFEANVWTAKNPEVRPSARCCHAMAYDSQSDRVVLFGGTAGGSGSATWAYDFDRDVWWTADDRTPPVIAVPDDVVEEATGASGAVVEYAVTVRDDVDDAVEPTCNPPSNSTFPLGVTTVTCTATDASGNQASASFAVNVVDTTAPTLALPGDVIAEATGPDGARVTYTAPSATDIVDGAITVSCSPPSGSAFPNGVTTVTCSARDESGNLATESFTVTVRAPDRVGQGGFTLDSWSIGVALVVIAAGIGAGVVVLRRRGK